MMIEVFTTDIREQAQAVRMSALLEDRFPGLKINMDLEDTTAPFPCGHSILRVEGTAIDPAQIISLLHTSDYQCAVLEDKICK